MSFTVQTETFEGPFDLLLHLILKDDVDLYEIKLNEIVVEYLEEISRMKNCDLEVATEFLLIAATLVELKCRRLLPEDDDLDLDEELALWEQRDLLLAKLLECKTFKDAAAVLQLVLESASRSVPRQSGLEEHFLHLTPDPLAAMTASKLKTAFMRVTSEKPKPEVTLHHVRPITATVTEAINEFVLKLPGSGQFSFRDLTAGLDERIEVVVRFLALLELFKQGAVELNQGECFGTLLVEWAGDPIDVDLTQAGLADHALARVDSYEG